MEKEFIPYEIALTLKELGFDGDCFAIWSGFDEINFSVTDKPKLYSSKFKIDNTQSATFYINDFKSLSHRVAAPTFSQAFRWFREKYKLEYHIKSEMIGYYTYIVDRNINKTLSLKNNIFQTYEKAELECLKKLIELCKNKQI